MISNTILSTISDAVSYMNFLKAKGYEVSLCSLDGVFRPCYEKFLLYLGHNFEYCIRIKENEKKICVKRQDILKEQISCEDFGPFECFAGVTEYVFPIEHNGKRYGIICLSGYRKGERLGDKSYSNLNSNIPNKETAKAVIMPLTYIMNKLVEILLNNKTNEEELSNSKKIYFDILNYIGNNLNRPIFIKDVSAHVNYSQSFVSKIFKKYSGKSLIEYVLDLKLKTAKEFLRNTDLSITDIALKIGYYNANDFTSIFKKRVGESPRSFRLRFK